MNRPKVLVVDDDAPTRKLIQKALEPDIYHVVEAASAKEALRQLEKGLFDVALIDLRLPDMSGLDLLQEIKSRAPAVEAVIATGYPDVGSAVEALKHGAYDYLQKPLNLQELIQCVNRAVERRLLRHEVGFLARRLGERVADRELIGASPAMAFVRETIAKVAPSDSPVLIEGESGTGKELAATALHRLSGRRHGPFIPVNCSAIPPDLLESELFGHVRGAFSGAVSDTLGLLRSANNGTLFLDEVGDLPTGLQGKLLRVLQENEVRPVGSSKVCAIDVRVIAATNRDLDTAVSDGSFRRDLFYRLNVVRIVMPPLRDHKEDVPALVLSLLRQLNQRFGRELKAVSPDAMAALMAHDFPGNVRELENILERAYALGATREIAVGDLPLLSQAVPASPQAETVHTLADMERDLIHQALRAFGGDREKAAQALGISPRTLYRRLKEYGLER